jgi:hypothetical protein
MAEVKKRKRLSKRAQKYVDSLTWSLDVTIAKMLLPLVKRFKHNYLKNIDPVSTGLTRDKLNDIVYALEHISGEKVWWGLNTKQEERIDRGCELFGKYLRHMWW